MDNTEQQIREILTDDEGENICEGCFQLYPVGSGDWFICKVESLSALLDQRIKERVEKHGDNYAVVIHAFAPGDPDVGIHPPSETITIHEPQFFDDYGGLEHRELLRGIFSKTFSELWDDRAFIIFDDECDCCGGIEGEHKQNCPYDLARQADEARLKALSEDKPTSALPGEE